MTDFLNNFWQNFSTYLMLGIIIIMLFTSIIFVLNFCVKQYMQYLNSLSEVTTGQLKSPHGRLLRYTQIQNLKNMKKFIGAGILLIMIVFVCLSSVIVLDSRTYFKQYFEIQRTKLNLRSEASVDSLQQYIIARNKTIDSLNIVVDGYKGEQFRMRNFSIEQQRTINALQKIIVKK